MTSIDDSTVTMTNGATIEGWTTVHRCGNCGSRGVYYLDYAAVFCPRCNDWLTVDCKEEGYRCVARPERPLAA